jgi:hypothetical protein
MLLWELYCDQPVTFLDMLQSLNELYVKRTPSWMGSLPSQTRHGIPYSGQVGVKDQYFQKIWGTIEEMTKMNQELSQRLPEVESLSKKIYADYEARRKNDKYFERFLGKFGPSSPHSHH